MAHVDDYLELSAAGRRYSYTLGLRVMKRTRNIYHSQEVEETLLDARYGGTLVIPEQRGIDMNPDRVRDNSQVGLLDPITWVEDLMGGLNTSEFELYHPTISTDAANYFGIIGSPSIERNFLRMTVVENGSPDPAMRGQYVKLTGEEEGDSPRIYKLRRVEGTTWWLVPGRLPWAAAPLIRPADTLRFRLLNPNDIEEYMDHYTRGPYRMSYIEAR